jgi:hypothetical protein
MQTHLQYPLKPVASLMNLLLGLVWVPRYPLLNKYEFDFRKKYIVNFKRENCEQE